MRVPRPGPTQLPTFGAGRVWIAASTVGPNEAGSIERHSVDEDDLVLDSFETWQAELPDLLLVLAPRQPQRFPVVARKLEQRGIRHARRTEFAQNLELPAVLLLDTVGELAGAFSLAQVAFVGGSIAPRGGHNILEPAAAGVAVVVGPHMENFEAIVQDFRAADALIEIPSAAELTATIRKLLTDRAEAAEFGRRAREVVIRNRGFASRLAERLWPIYYGAFRSYPHNLVSRSVLAPLACLWEKGGIQKRQRSSTASAGAAGTRYQRGRHHRGRVGQDTVQQLPDFPASPQWPDPSHSNARISPPVPCQSAGVAARDRRFRRHSRATKRRSSCAQGKRLSALAAAAMKPGNSC